jgi:hypothetical protein
MEILKEPIKKEDLPKFMSYFKTVIKAVVDIKREIIALDAQLHADLEKLLIGDGSFQEDLWGINLYPFKDKDFIEYNALINIRPHQNNFSMEIEDKDLKEKIKKIVEKLIK